jgi:hypothetical protein
MPTTLQSETARINGAKSNGPVTPEGKAKSSQNAVKHGACCRNIVLANESPEDYTIMRSGWIHHLKPAGPVELDLVEEIVACRWRLRRIWAAETAAIDVEMIRQEESVNHACETIDEASRTAFAFSGLAAAGRTLSTYRRLEASLSRQYQRALDSLRQLQAERKNPPATEDQPPEPIPVYDNFRNEPARQYPQPLQIVIPAEDPPKDLAA